MSEKNRIPFNRPPVTGRELEYLRMALEEHHKLSGDGPFTKKCHRWMETELGAPKALMTTSCTHALEMAAVLLDIRSGDEVIMPSYTFVSTANAFVLRGARLVFTDIRPDTMNLDESRIEDAVTPKTRAIVPVHYAGVACDMDVILDVAQKHGLAVVEDAAQGVTSFYKGRALGTIGDLGCYSFHETKNYSSGEGGALCVNRPDLAERAEIIREKGTDRARFFRGQVDKYSWQDAGSSWLPSELNAACLFAQLESWRMIFDRRMELWNRYEKELSTLKGRADLPVIPDDCRHNAHMFYLKVNDLEERTRLIDYLKNQSILSVFHYVPLHSSPAGRRFGRFHGEDRYTTRESERLIRLPLFYGMTDDEQDAVIRNVLKFFGNR